MNIKSVLLCLAFFVAGIIGYWIGASKDEGRLALQAKLEVDNNNETYLSTESSSFVNSSSNAKSVIWTNVGPGSYQLADKIISVPIEMPIYDIAFTKYSAFYAQKYGYPVSHVLQMPEYVHLIEFRMKTVGRKNQCRLNMLLEKELNVNFPDRPFVNQIAINSSDRAAIIRPKRNSDWRESEEIKNHRIAWFSIGSESLSDVKYSMRNAIMSTVDVSDYKKGSSVDVRMLEYNPQLYADLNYVSFNIGCGSLTKQFLNKPENYLWIKKKTGRDYSKTVNYIPSDFLGFKIPKEIRVQFNKYIQSVPTPIYKIGIEKINNEIIETQVNIKK